MKWFKRIVIAVPVIIVVILVTVFLINQITPKPISLLVRKQFDTSEKEQVSASYHRSYFSHCIFD